MTQPLMDFGIGFLTGGLAVSAAWGFFWFVIGVIGRTRRTCGWEVVMKGLVGGVVPLSLLLGLLWWHGGSGDGGWWFLSGLPGIPALLVLLSLRPMSGGGTAGSHLIEGIRSLMTDLLEAHQGCGGCCPEREHETCR
jgi:hypothetical protein